MIATTGGAPGIGNSSFAITLLAPALTAGSAALLFARESAVFGGLSLPAELGFIGAPDCFLETDVALVFSLPVGGGNAVAGLPIPASPGLIGQAFSAQWVFPDAGANALGLGFSQGGRMVIAETSGTPEYDATREFYVRTGYKAEAIIKDFYKPGDDLFVFIKRI